MCGIAGIINFNREKVDENNILTMMKTMKHRGPDDEGTFINNNIGLGFVRLSILDLSPLGHQPMFDLSGRYVIIHNGEVYNYIELRDELEKKGYKFRSNTDTEVVLNSYIEWGEDCLHKFNGMWAFVIYDKKSKHVFIARDRFGIKPFYYYLDDQRFVFASEISPILDALRCAHSAKRIASNYQAIFDYLVFNRTDQTEKTFFEGIKKLQHGHIIEIKNSKLKIKKWYDLRSRINKPFKNAEEYRETFSSAVGLRLRSDVPVGVCLSGGLDSSSIVSVLLKDYDKSDLNTFSAVYGEGITGDESKFINEYKKYLKNMYFTCPNSDTLLNDMSNFVKAHGEPIPSTSPYAQFKVMELAKDHVIVTLDGQGADEQLAGYHYFYGFYFKDLVNSFRFFRFFSEIGYYLYHQKSIYALKTFIYFLLPDMLKSKARVSEKGYLDSNFVYEYSGQNSVTSNIYGSESLIDALLDHFEYKLEHLLKWEDRNSMWFSLESRVPFLDYRLVERTLSLAADLIINRGYTKYILREAMKDTLPDKIRLRKDKIGFDTPSGEWFRNINFENYINDILNNGSFLNSGIINQDKAKNLYQKHLMRKVDVNKEIWKWINLEKWHKEYFTN